MPVLPARLGHLVAITLPAFTLLIRVALSSPPAYEIGCPGHLPWPKLPMTLCMLSIVGTPACGRTGGGGGAPLKMCFLL